MNAFASSSHHNSNCNEILLEAVRKNNIGEVKRLLRNPKIDVNYDIGDGATVLFETLFTKNMEIFELLVKAGFSIHHRNALKETPLHVAVTHSNSKMIKLLIKKGADINAKERYDQTPLSHAAFHENINELCMLLYYGADVNTVCKDNMNPFMWALENDQEDAADILYHFYDEFSCKSKSGSTALDFAALNSSPLTIDIFKKSTFEDDCLESVLISSLDYKNATLFKLIWSKHKEDIFAQLDKICENLLISICGTFGFKNNDWLECLHLLFTSPITFANSYSIYKKPLLTNCLYKRKIDLHDRIVLMNLCTSSGIDITAEGINLTYLLYGFNEEVKIFIHTLNYQQNNLQNDFLPLPRLIFALEDNYKIEIISPILKFLKKRNIHLEDIVIQKIIIRSLGFTSLSFSEKQSIKNLWMGHFSDNECIVEKLDTIPEMPTLLELSRNQLRQFIKQRCGVSRAYHFYTVINKLNLPPCLKDVVCFKTALY